MCSSVSFSELNHSAYLTTNVANSEQKIDLIPKQLMTNLVNFEKGCINSYVRYYKWFLIKELNSINYKLLRI